jgi:polyferredoxin
MPSQTRLARHPNNCWITARKAVQYAALLAFLALFIAARQSGWPASLLNLAMRLDPLLILANLLSSRLFLTGSALTLITLLLTLIFGRAWCGWLCPLGTVLDLFALKAWRGQRQPPPESWRSLKYGLLLVILTAALFGNLTLLALDPLTILFRSLAVSLWPALDQVVTAVETALYQVPFLAGPVSVLDAWLRPRFLPLEPVFYRSTVLFAGFFLGVIALNLWASRFWCRYLCPLGGLLGLLSKLALFRRQVGEECKGCTLCTAACPTGTIDPHKGFASDPSECTLCLDCLEACPRSQVAFTPGLKPAKWSEYDPGRRAALLSIGAAAAGVALLRAGALNRYEPPHLLRPPGAREINSDIVEMTRCIRCSECMRACPTGALQAAVFEAGMAGFATPLLTPRLGYCDYSCNACGQICPVQAIPPLSLEDKRQAVIGKAVLDRNRCLPWSGQTPCIVCEEMCPLPQKAIQLEEAQVEAADGAQLTLQRPYVLRERCTGCGICEYKCPLNGEAAIRVFVT